MSYRSTVVGAGLGYVIAGPVGAVLGGALATGDGEGHRSGMQDIPYGLYVDVATEDDAVGRRFTIRFLCDVPPDAHAVLRFMNDAGERVRGRAPFVDGDGAFVAAATVREKRCTAYVPWGAAVFTTPKHLSLEVSLWAAGPGGARPVGKSTLDADLPPPRPFNVADVLAPLTSLAAHVLAADDGSPAAREAMVTRLADALGFDASALPEGTLRAMGEHARAPLPFEAALHHARFRFPELDGERLLALVAHAAAVDEGARGGGPAQRELLARLRARGPTA